MLERVCLASSHEIGLKGRNRSVFERRLQVNLDAALDGLAVGRVQRLSSRFFVRVFEPDASNDVAATIARVPGVNTVSAGVRVPASIADIEAAALAVLTESAPFATFAVDAHRSNTDFATGSQELNRVVGAHLQRETGAAVDLTRPDVTVGIIVAHGDAYVSATRLKGVGGLPVGTAGTVVSLLSSGIDSPVATWRMMRRGAVCVGVHFSGRPQVSADSERLVARIGSVLEQTGGLGRIYVVPFGDVQKEVALTSPPDLRVILYRRLMVRIAERIARVERAKALVTGESLGQVASQTLANMAAIDEAAELLVLRPLVGSDKLEIMADARTLGTYALSIQDAPDCCTLFMPRTPETQARLATVLDAWAALPCERLVDDALARLEWLDFRCSSYRPPKRWPTHGGASGSGAAEIVR